MMPRKYSKSFGMNELTLETITEVLLAICFKRRSDFGINEVMREGDCNKLKCGLGCPFSYEEENNG